MSDHAWFAGLTVDHLYENCPNRTRAEKELRKWGWWDLSQTSGLDPEGDLVCGVCVYRWRRTERAA